jgi:hypothetical protein
MNRFNALMNFIKRIFISVLLTVTGYTLPAQGISTTDIPNFWKAYDALASSQDSVKTFQELYIDPGSIGLKEFLKKRSISTRDYLTNIKKYPAFWQNVRRGTLEAISQKNSIENSLLKLQKEYPKLKYPKIYFVIGKMNSAGTTGASQVLIGSEIALADSSVVKHELEPWLQQLFNEKKDIAGLVIHETVHVQQRNSLPFIFQYVLKRKVYAACVREGAADFVSEKITNAISQSGLYRYGNEHFSELKSEFSQSMNTSEVSQWLYNYATNKNRPADLGYFMGYKICEAYYQKSTDKEKALRTIIQTKNPKKILKKSGLF